MKLLLLILLIWVGYRAGWFVVDADPSSNAMKKAAVALAFILSLLALYGAGKLLADIIA